MLFQLIPGLQRWSGKKLSSPIDVADQARPRGDRVGERREAVGDAIGRAGEARVAMAFEDHVGRRPALAFQPDRGAAGRVGLVEAGKRGEGGGGGEHLGVGGRDEARVGRDRDELPAVLGRDDEAEAGAGARLAQPRLDALLERLAGAAPARRRRRRDAGRAPGSAPLPERPSASPRHRPSHAGTLSACDQRVHVLPLADHRPFAAIDQHLGRQAARLL